MPKKEEVRDMFNNIAGSYDKLNHIMSLDIDKSWRNKAIKYILRENKPLEILDLACGTGDFAISIADKLKQKGDKSSHIFGVDISEGMLKIMKQKIDDKGLSSCISIKLGDGEHLDFGDSTFDFITIAFGIRNFENKEAGLKEMLRVLKEGGQLIILELSMPENRVMRFFYNIYFGHILPIIGGLISGDRKAYIYLPDSVKGFPSRKVFMKMMYDVGFAKVEHKALTGGVCRMYIGTK